MSSQFFPLPPSRLMALLVAALASRSAAAGSRLFQSHFATHGSLKVRLRACSSSSPVTAGMGTTTTMSLRGHGYSTRRLGGAPGKGSRRSSGGGNGGHGGNRGGGVQKRTAAAGGRRSAFGEDRTSGTEARRWGGGGGWIDAGGSGGYVNGARGGGGGGGGEGRLIGKAKGEFGRQYKARRAGGTFAAKATTSGNLLGSPPKWDFKKVDLSVLARPTLKDPPNPKVNLGGKRRGATAAVSSTIDAPHGAFGAKTTRSRGAKRSFMYAGLSMYSSHFSDLVSLELNHEKEKAYERMQTWSNRELAAGGFAVEGLVGTRVGRLFREHVVRFSLPPRRRENRVPGQAVRRPPMPFHRFSAGDVVAITLGSKPPSPDVMEQGDVVDAVVLQRMPHFLDVVVKVVPEGLADMTPSGYVRMGGSTAQFRLDQFVNGISYERMLQALQTATAPETLSVCPVVRGLVIDSLMPTLGRIDEIERRGGLRPGVGDAVLPPGLSVPDEEFARKALGQGKGPTPDCSKGKVKQVVADVAIDCGLSKRQTQAIRQALESRLTLIQGPPGTGKTKTACSLILAAVKLRKNKGARSDGKVMATAFSNVAADNLLEGVLKLGMRVVRIGRPATVRPTLWPATLDALVESNPDVVAAKSKLKPATAAEDAGNDSEQEAWVAGSDGSDSDNGNADACGQQQQSRGSSRRPSSTAHRNAMSQLEKVQAAAAQEILRQAEVVVCSCIGAGNEIFVNAIGGDPDSGFSSIRFSTVVIDEATQATEAAALVPLVRGCQQLVLVGDQNQLPPTVLCPEAQAGGFGTSLFARLMHAGLKPVLLDKQYRMHPLIADFSSHHFYGGQVTSGTRPADRPTPRGFPWPRRSIPVAFIRVSDGVRGVSKDVVFSPSEAAEGVDNDQNGSASHVHTHEDGGSISSGRGMGMRGQLERKGGKEAAVQGGDGRGAATAEMGTSFCNRREADAVAFALDMLVAAGDVEVKDVGIITPYSAQVRLLQDVVGASRRSSAAAAAAAVAKATDSSDSASGDEGRDERGDGQEREWAGRGHRRHTVDLPEIASVDGYQGREKEVILLSAVRSNYGGRVGFLSDWRRLNVAITRARRGVVVVGDPDTLERDPHWRAFLRWCDSHGAAMDESALYGARGSGIGGGRGGDGDNEEGSRDVV